jgi:hypothetical protein
MPIGEVEQKDILLLNYYIKLLFTNYFLRGNYSYRNTNITRYNTYIVSIF